MNNFLSIIKEICEELNIKFKTISKNWISILEKDNNIRYIIGYKFDINGNGISRIMDDKYAFYELVKLYNFPVIEHNIIFKDYDKSKIKNLFYKYNQNVVVKINTGTCGTDVFNINLLDDLYKTIDDLFKNNYSLSLCPYINIKNEYRVIILKDKVLLIYGKEKPVVYGDGKSSIEDLLIKFNPTFFKKRKNLSKNILKINAKYEYDWKFNLSRGAMPFLNIDNKLAKKLEYNALIIAKKLNLEFCSLDFIVDDKDNLLLMEANSGVMMDNFMKIVPNGKIIAKNIYKKAIVEMFKK